MTLRRIVSWGLIAIVVLVAAVLVVSWFIPWTPLNCRHDDVDIRTGRIRHSQYLALCKVSESVEETVLSRVLAQEMIENLEPDWERVNTFSPGIRYSPHYRFHGALSQIRELEILWQEAKVDLSTQRKMASHVLALWQLDGSYFSAGRYLDGLSDLLDAKKREPLLRTIGALTMPEEHVEGDHLVLTVFYPDGHPMERVRGYRDSSSQFVRHGTWETWHLSGKRECYGHFGSGTHHGQRFNWDSDGKLASIERFNHNELIDYESQNLETRPEYAEAQGLLETGSYDRMDGSETPRP
jgi:hypothetical protein